MQFIDDTGANVMGIWDSDLDELIHYDNLTGPIPLNLGDHSITTASTPIVQKSVLLEVRVSNYGLFSKWYRMEVLVRPTPSSGPVDRTMRLSGSWWREVVYTATVPDSQRNLLACDNYWEFMGQIPDVNPEDVIPISPPKVGENAIGAFRTGNTFDLFLPTMPSP